MGIDEDYLAQTLSKKMLTVHKSQHSFPIKTSVQDNAITLGQNVPSGDVDISSGMVSLIGTGACGAFVHGFEDEYEEVRAATIGKKKRFKINY